jgi:hypothetical protein
MANPECNALTYVPGTNGSKDQVLVRSIPNAQGQVTTFTFPWSGPPLIVAVPPANNSVPLSSDAPYQSGG